MLIGKLSLQAKEREICKVRTVKINPHFLGFYQIPAFILPIAEAVLTKIMFEKLIDSHQLKSHDQDGAIFDRYWLAPKRLVCEA